MGKTINIGILSVLLGISVLPSAFAIDISISKKDDSRLREGIIEEAKKYLGVPYVTGGITKKGFDCSGLVYRVFLDSAKMEMTRLVQDLARAGEPVKGSPLNADLLFFDTDGKGKASHVGISVGDNKFIHAASAGSKTGVIVSSLTEEYYKKRFLNSRRIIPLRFPACSIVFNNFIRAKKTFPDVLSIGLPMYVNLENKLSYDTFFNVKVYRDSKMVISKRIRTVHGTNPAEFWFIPDSGKWTFSVEDAKNDEIANISFY
jgi:hypothetical protein